MLRIIKNNLGRGYDFADLYFCDDTRGIARITNQNNGAVNELYVTDDGGYTWERTSEPGLNYVSMSFADQPGAIRQGIALTDNGEIYRIVLHESFAAPFTGFIKLDDQPEEPVPNLNDVHYTFSPRAVSIAFDPDLNKIFIGVVSERDFTSAVMPLSGKDAVFYMGELDLNIVPTPLLTWSEIDVETIPSGDNFSMNTFICNSGYAGIDGCICGNYSFMNLTTGIMAVNMAFKYNGTGTFPVFQDYATTIPMISSYTADGSNHRFFGITATDKKVYRFTFPAGNTSSPAVISSGAFSPDLKDIFFQNQTATLIGSDSYIARLDVTNVVDAVQTLRIVPQPINDLKLANNKPFACGDDGYVMVQGTSGSQFWFVPDEANSSREKLNAIALNHDGTNYQVLSAGDNGFLLHYTTPTASFDLAQGAQFITMPVQGNLYDVIFSGTEGYAAGQAGLFKLTDVFTSSNLQASVLVTNSGATFRGLNYIPNTQTFEVIAVGERSSVYQVAGNNTAKIHGVYLPGLSKVHFSGSQNGAIVGDNFVIRTTRDDGLTWTAITTSAFANSTAIPLLKSVVMKTDGTVFACGSKYYIGKIDVVNQVPDETIATVTFQGGTTISCNDIAFADDNTGYVVGRETASTGFYALTTDGGNTWVSHQCSTTTGPTVTATPLNALHVCTAASKNVFVAVGESGNIWVYQKDNSGLNIFKTDIFDPAATEPPFFGASALLDVFFQPDLKTGYVVGDKGTIAKCKINNNDLRSVTANGDISWQGKTNIDDIEITNGSGQSVRTIAFSTQTDGFVGGCFIGMTSGYTQPYARKLHEEATQFSSRFWYDKVGRLTVSQNTRQYNRTHHRSYSYTLYDKQGRIVEVGEKIDSTFSIPQIRFKNIFGSYIGTNYNTDVIDHLKFEEWIENDGERKEVTHTYYDETHPDISAILPSSFTPENLRQRVSSVTYEDLYDGNEDIYQTASHYSYDIHGNVKSLLQENQEFRIPPAIYKYHRFKRIDYEYDLVSGKVNDVHYQNGEYDAFHHHYRYDADNRLIEALTSKFPYAQWVEQHCDHLWDLDARYSYYLHGPLARVEIGDNEVQGLDYAYSIQGWLKGLNSSSLTPLRDIGNDGLDGTNQVFAQDAFGFTLGYFDGDYKAINDDVWLDENDRFETITLNSGLLSERSDLFNGNIGIMVATLKDPSYHILPLGSAFKYDQLNRIQHSKTFANANMANTDNNWSSNGVSAMYQSDYCYDGNGNIRSLKRYDHTGAMFDELEYHYDKDLNSQSLLRNRLYNVNETAGVSSMTMDIEDQQPFDSDNPNVTNNYSYDELGNLTRDEFEEISSIDWTLSGKIKWIHRASGSLKKELSFDYDPMGNRIAKHVYDVTNGWESTSYYIRDAQGNILSTYEKKRDDFNNVTTFMVDEQPIYGSSRLGVYRSKFELTGHDVPAPFEEATILRELDQKNFEINDHLGNVHTVISSRKTPVYNGTVIEFQPDIIRATDYYPFGMQMPGRSYKREDLALQPGKIYITGLRDFQSETVTLVINGNPIPNTSFAYPVSIDVYLTDITNNLTAYNIDYTRTGNTIVIDNWYDGTSTDISVSPASGAMKISNFDEREYAFGFNGKENDNEVKGSGNQQDYGMRIYDNRLGRFFSMDPLSKSFPWYAPYQFAGNKPVWAKDLDGLEEWIFHVEVERETGTNMLKLISCFRQDHSPTIADGRKQYAFYAKDANGNYNFIGMSRKLDANEVPPVSIANPYSPSAKLNKPNIRTDKRVIDDKIERISNNASSGIAGYINTASDIVSIPTDIGELNDSKIATNLSKGLNILGFATGGINYQQSNKTSGDKINFLLDVLAAVALPEYALAITISKLVVGEGLKNDINKATGEYISPENNPALFENSDNNYPELDDSNR